MTANVMAVSSNDRLEASSPRVVFRSTSRSRMDQSICIALLLSMAWVAGCENECPQETDRPLTDRTPSTAVSTIGFGSCLEQHRPQPIWDAVLRVRPDRFVFLGDNVYGDVSDLDDRDLPELRTAYRCLAGRRRFQRLRNEIAVMAVWDDHDFGINDGGADFPLRAESQTLFREFWNIPDDDPRAQREGLYHSVTTGTPGEQVQIVLLDTRYFRSPWRRTTDPRPPDHSPYVPSSDASLTMLGDEQWAWLERTLQAPADVRVIASSIQVLSADPRGEHWGYFPHERERLLSMLRGAEARTLVLLSGDRHMGGLFREGDLWEVTASALNQLADVDVRTPVSAQVGTNYGEENFGLLQVDWEREELQLELRDIAGNTVRQAVVPFRSE